MGQPVQRWWPTAKGYEVPCGGVTLECNTQRVVVLSALG